MKLVLGVLAVLALSLGALAHGTSEELVSALSERAQLEEELARARAEAARLPRLATELAALGDTFGARARALPPLELATRERLLVALQQHAEAVGVRPAQVSCDERPTRPIPGGGAVVELALALELEGPFAAAVAFLARAEAEPGLTQTRTLALAPGTARLELSTFRYRAKQTWE